MNIGAYIASLITSSHGTGKQQMPLMSENGEPVQLREGDSVKAEVTENRPDGKVAFKMPGGQHFLAEAMSDRLFVPGQRVTLSVVEVRAGVPMVEITGENTPSSETFLKAMNAPKTERNLLLAQEALLQRAEFTPKQFAALAKTVAAFEGLPAEQAVFMARHNIPIKPETVAQYKALAQPQAHLGSLLQKLLTLLPDRPTPVPAPAQTQTPTPVQTQTPTPIQTQTPAPIQTQTPAPVQTQAQAPAQTQTSAPVQTQTPAHTHPPVQIQAPAPAQAPLQAQAATPAPTPAPVPAPIQPQMSEPAPAPAGHPLPAKGDAAPAPVQVQAPLPAPVLTPTPVQIQVQMPVPAPIAAEVPVAHSPQIPVPTPAQTPVQAQTTAPLQVPVQMQAPATAPAPVQAQSPAPVQIQQSAPATAPAPVSVAETPTPVQVPIREVLVELFAKVEPSRNRELPRELDAPKITREIGRVLARALETVRDLPEQTRAEVLRVTRDIVQTLRFSEQLGNCATYAQLPLSVNGERTTAQLYVFNDSGKTKKIDPQNATVFLSLSTANIGMVEGFIKVIGLGVEADFSLQSEESARLFRSGLTELSELLEAQGYRLERLSAAVAQNEEPTMPAAVEKGHFEMAGRYTFNRAV